MASIESVEKLVSMVASFVSTLAIILGGIFAWRRWGREAPAKPRGELSHDITHCILTDSHRLVHVTLCLKNVGTATLKPTKAYTKLFQVSPVPWDLDTKRLDGGVPLGITETEFDWPSIGEREYPVVEDQVRIDSGESEKYGADFIIATTVAAIFIYSMACLDPDDSDLGWDITTFYEFTTDCIPSAR